MKAKVKCDICNKTKEPSARHSEIKFGGRTDLKIEITNKKDMCWSCRRNLVENIEKAVWLLYFPTYRQGDKMIPILKYELLVELLQAMKGEEPSFVVFQTHKGEIGYAPMLNIRKAKDKILLVVEAKNTGVYF